eukprot:UN16984
MYVCFGYMISYFYLPYFGGFLCLLILTFLLAFSVSGWLLFSDEVEHFRNLPQSFLTLFSSSVSDLPLEELQNSSSFGSLYYILWFLVMPFVMLNIIIAILMTSWEKVMRERDATRTEQQQTECQRFLQWCNCQICKCCVPKEDRKKKIASRNLMEAENMISDPKQWARP